MQGLIVELGLQRLSVVGTSMGRLMTFALNALSPGLIERAVINDIGPEIAQEGLDRIKSYVGVAGPFENWEEATPISAQSLLRSSPIGLTRSGRTSRVSVTSSARDKS